MHVRRRVAIASMSLVRTRVASSDWCASRIVVSVSSGRFCSLDPLDDLAGGPPSARICAVPGGGGWRAAIRRPAAHGGSEWHAPATALLAPERRVAVHDHVAEVAQQLGRAVLAGLISNSSGVSSRKRVQVSPRTKRGC
jgi:hypothetical protein